MFYKQIFIIEVKWFETVQGVLEKGKKTFRAVSNLSSLEIYTGFVWALQGTVLSSLLSLVFSMQSHVLQGVPLRNIAVKALATSPVSNAITRSFPS